MVLHNRGHRMLEHKYYCVAHPTTMVGDIIVENCGYTTITAAATKDISQQIRTPIN